MILGKVVGSVWSTRKSPWLEGVKLLLVKPCGMDNPEPDTDVLVAADTVGAGVGDEVVICMGEPARRALGDRRYPVEAAILGIVDRLTWRAQDGLTTNTESAPGRADDSNGKGRKTVVKSVAKGRKTP